MVRFLFWMVPVANVVWLAWAWWRSGFMGHRRRWRAAAVAFFCAMMLLMAWVVLSRGETLHSMPAASAAAVAYIWQVLVVLPVAASIVVGELILLLLRKQRARRAQQINRRQKLSPEIPAATGENAPESGTTASRRQFLTAAALTAPPLLTVITGIAGLPLSERFRIRRLDVFVPALPADLDGVTIAHVSDIHAGTFVDEKLLRAIADATNALRADVVAVTGDLIDYSLSDLPGALECIRRFDAPGGVFACEGNHDLFQSRRKFESAVKKSGVRMLLNECESIRLRGRPVQMIGVRWGFADEANAHTPHSRVRHEDDAGAGRHLAALRSQFDPEAFPILLAHHPHAFDAAAEEGIALTLAGHTHGGQLMLTQNIGAGPMMYRYWSGLYRKEAARLVVSNGVGNWFPLRVNAPAEIIHITLRGAALA